MEEISVADAAVAEVYVDATGRSQKSLDDVNGASPQAVTNTACLELINGIVSFVIDVTFDPITYPFAISGGTIKSGICGAPWAVTSGIMGASLRIDATRQGTGSCANTIIIVGELQGPPSWRGTYGFDGSASAFKHTTLFRAWESCP